MASKIELSHLDHLVLTVADIEASCKFYTEILGMKVVNFTGCRKALTFGQSKINLHESGHEFKPHAHHPTKGSADVCLIVSTPLDQVISHLNNSSVPIVEGPVQRTGARGPILSVYIRDPDLNLIELSNNI